MEIPELRAHTGGFTFTNGYLYGVNGRFVVVDAPEGMADRLKEWGARPEALLLTHCHFDHVVDAARIAREHGCPVCAWGPSTPEDRLEDYLLQWARIEYRVENYPVDRLLRDETELEIAGFRFRLEHVPGHSPDSVVFIDEARRVVFSGDTLMNGGVGRSDFPGGDGALLSRGIREKILSLPEDFRVLSGHGRETSVGAEKRGNPWLA